MPSPEEVSPTKLEAHVIKLAREIGERNVFNPQALHSAADYITATWQAQGYHVIPYTYRVSGVDCANLEITRPGQRRPDELLLIAAHYDSVIGSPGANDNGSGVAALLELSRLFTQLTPDISVRFVAFVNEEPPFFMWKQMGSLVYAKMARRRGDNIRLMASLETIGYFRGEPRSQRYPPLFRAFYPDRGDFIAFVSNLVSRRLMHRAAAAFRAYSDFPLEQTATFALVPGVAWSDHFSFWRQRYRAFMVTDTAFYRYPYYHTADDTPEKLDYSSLTQVTSGLFQAFAALAGRDSVYAL
ncbi:MAG: M28 family peptidase [Gammaproteobacteria bacterium]|nr:M28 family peptidase [Gammaproteobacteria bacterium]